jgi:FlaA1/EpsC-like NDP-sugar epimerase
MKIHFDIDTFISKYITKRNESLLSFDLKLNNTKLKRRINGKKVLVIGGAGSIGSSYIKAILKFNVLKLVVIDTNENGLTELVRDLRSSTIYNIPKDFITYPVNFGGELFDKIFKLHGPFEVVANFAAHKHVRSEKDIISIEAMIENNLFYAEKLLKLLEKNPPEHFFCVSTDKAANPVNIMGASKKLMEELILSYSGYFPVKTARFANVAFSNGSLLDGFLHRLEKKQPLSCPLGIRRFFLSPQESGELCLIASILGESGDIFFPKLHEEDMISFDGIMEDFMDFNGISLEKFTSEEEAKQKAFLLTAYSTNYPVHLMDSNTSGEKLYEEFYTENEILDLDSFNELGIIKSKIMKGKDQINKELDSLRKSFASYDLNKNTIIGELNLLIPNFDHIETGENLDSKM